MIYFTEEYLNFFKELAANNHKEWFHANKKRYEQHVKKPFEVFVTDLIKEIQKHDVGLELETKDSLMRINRDIRFSKDKTPYNLHKTAFVSRGGKKNKSIPGIFLRFSPEMIGIMGGCYGLEKEPLANVRHTLAKKHKDFRSLLDEKEFKKHFGEIKGETIKRIPKDLQEAHKQEPLIANKQFYYVNEMKPEAMLKNDLMDQIMKRWHMMRPVGDFLTKAMK